MKTVGITACSNAQKVENKAQNEELADLLKSKEYDVIISKCIYEKEGCFSGTGEERANELMKLFANPKTEEIYDISGGDMANEVLDFLDFEVIKKSKARFWGYSDLTTVINAIYAQTAKKSVLYQVKNMVHGRHTEEQRKRFFERGELFNPCFEMVQGEGMRGIVVGGNIRCFLKLAGTKYMPNLEGKLLLLEAMGGTAAQMTTYLAQLRSMGAFEKVNGVILGTFCKMEDEQIKPDITELVKRIAGEKISVARTKEIGHRSDSKAVIIGSELEIK